MTAEVLTVELRNFPRSRTIELAVFELVFDLFDRVMQGRVKKYSIGFQGGELKVLLYELGETKCKCMPF